MARLQLRPNPETSLIRALQMMQYFPLPNAGVGTDSYDRFNNWIGSDPALSQTISGRSRLTITSGKDPVER
jgi:hypothetical protein